MKYGTDQLETTIGSPYSSEKQSLQHIIYYKPAGGVSTINIYKYIHETKSTISSSGHPPSYHPLLGVPLPPSLLHLLPPASPVPHVLAPSIDFVVPGCSGGVAQGHRLQPREQTRGAGAGCTAAGAGEVGTGETAEVPTLRDCPCPHRPPSGSSGRN